MSFGRQAVHKVGHYTLAVLCDDALWVELNPLHAQKEQGTVEGVQELLLSLASFFCLVMHAVICKIITRKRLFDKIFFV